MTSLIRNSNEILVVWENSRLRLSPTATLFDPRTPCRSIWMRVARSPWPATADGQKRRASEASSLQRTTRRQLSYARLQKYHSASLLVDDERAHGVYRSSPITTSVCFSNTTSQVRHLKGTETTSSPKKQRTNSSDRPTHGSFDPRRAILDDGPRQLPARRRPSPLLTAYTQAATANFSHQHFSHLYESSLRRNIPAWKRACGFTTC